MTAPWDGPTPADNVFTFEAWKAGLRYKPDDRTLEPKAFANFRLLLTFHPAVSGKIRFNSFTGEIEIGAVPWREDSARMRLLSDSDIVRAREWLQGSGLTPTKEESHAAIIEAGKSQAYDPVVDYLAGQVWDGKPRIDRWLIDIFGVRDTPYARAVGSKWLISACARAFDPGCKADYMLVLEGGQDIGKSSALRVLASPDWFTEFVSDLRDHKRFVEQITGKWIIEFAELATLGKSDMEMVKAVITMQVDRVRLSYAHTASNLPRRCVLAATINPKAGGTYLTDETGNKRFWPVLCQWIDIDRLKNARDQLWAEAAQRYRAGEQWWLTNEERDDAVRHQAARVAKSPWEDWLSEPGRLAERDEWTSVQLLDLLKIPVRDQKQSDKNEIARIMNGMGWVNKVRKVNGRAVRTWRDGKDTDVDPRA